jgi:hypothetical protein
LSAWYTTDWIYTIDPDWAWWVPQFDTYCDMTTNWWWWTLVSMERLNWTSVDWAVWNIWTFTSLNQTTSFKVSDAQWKAIPFTIWTKIINFNATFYVKYWSLSWASSLDNWVYATTPVPSCSLNWINNWTSWRPYHIADCWYVLSMVHPESYSYAVWDGLVSVNCSWNSSIWWTSETFACVNRNLWSWQMKTAWVK